jgi:putative endonuclease
MFYIYILKQNNGNLYTGYSGNLKRRITEHNEGKVRTTKNNLPIKLILYEGYLFREDAIRREKYLKSSDGKRDIKRQLSFAFAALKIHNSKSELLIVKGRVA